MKTNKLFLVAVIATVVSLSFSSCGPVKPCTYEDDKDCFCKENPNDSLCKGPEVIITDAAFVGNLVVTQPDATTFTKSDLQVQLITTSKADSVVLYLVGVQFSPLMPISINMKLPLQATVNGNLITLSGNNVTPLMLQGGVDVPFTTFQANDIIGKISGNNLNLNMTLLALADMGSAIHAGDAYPMEYLGTKIEE